MVRIKHKPIINILYQTLCNKQYIIFLFPLLLLLFCTLKKKIMMFRWRGRYKYNDNVIIMDEKNSTLYKDFVCVRCALFLNPITKINKYKKKWKKMKSIKNGIKSGNVCATQHKDTRIHNGTTEYLQHIFKMH